MTNIAAVVNAIKSVQPRKQLQKPAAVPADGPCYWQNSDVAGYQHIRHFEARLASMLRVPAVVATSSGTAALHLALLSAGVRAGDEVLLPSLTFAATANAVIYCGAIPHFVDVTTESLGVNPYKLRNYLADVSADIGGGLRVNRETGRRISAIVAVHLLGLPCDVPALVDLARTYRLTVVEDAAEALGTFVGVRPAGTIGNAGMLSFNNNKIVTTGGGGAVLCNSTAQADVVRHLATTAKIVDAKYHWRHDAIGYNYRPNNIACAIGAAQLVDFDNVLLRPKLKLAHDYARALKPYCEVLLCPGANYWLVAARMATPADAEALIEELLVEGYEARPLFTPLHQQEPWAYCPRQPSLSVTTELAAHVVCLPSSVEAIYERPERT